MQGKNSSKKGIDTTNPAKTLSNVCPASMLAKSLTDRLIGLIDKK